MLGSDRRARRLSFVGVLPNRVGVEAQLVCKFEYEISLFDHIGLHTNLRIPFVGFASRAREFDSCERFPPHTGSSSSTYRSTYGRMSVIFFFPRASIPTTSGGSSGSEWCFGWLGQGSASDIDSTATRRAPRLRELPPAALLPLPILGAELAAGVRAEELARIEPVLRSGSSKDRRQIPAKIGNAGAAVVPEPGAIRHLLEAEDLLYAAVAVRGDDEDTAGQLGRRELR